MKMTSAYANKMLKQDACVHIGCAALDTDVSHHNGEPAGAGSQNE